VKFTTYSHCGGLEMVSEAQRSEIETALTQCTLRPALRVATKIRTALLVSLVKAGWSGEVTVAAGSGITISSSKNNIGLCLQTGNMSRVYADLIKLQKLFLDDAIKAGVIVVPTGVAAKALGSNIANANRIKKELEIFRKVLHMPIILFAFE
jgi:hypothetical protein